MTLFNLIIGCSLSFTIGIILGNRHRYIVYDFEPYYVSCDPNCEACKLEKSKKYN